MRRILSAAAGCLALAAVAAPALAQPPAPPPSDATPPGAAAPPAIAVTTTDAPPADAAPPPAMDAPPPPAADPGPPPPPPPADARPPLRDGGVRVGTLSCRAAGGWGLLIGSRRPIACDYQGQFGDEHYEGELTKIGVDVGYKGKGEVVWTVVAPTAFVKAGDLKGHYGGVTAGASVVVGVAANALVGGNRHQVSLQPLSVEGNTGLNASAGLGGLDLRYTGVTP